MWLYLLYVFFFKQKTAYEIKECDWSSDVCSSDLFLFVPCFESHVSAPDCVQLIQYQLDGVEGGHSAVAYLIGL